jgi:glycerol uptake facilitator-like aquaporin
VWAAATIGALGAYILVRGLSAQAMSYDDPRRASHAGDLSPMTDGEVVSRAIAVAAVATLVLVVVLLGPFG